MKWSTLIKAVAERTGQSERVVRDAMPSMVEVSLQALRDGEDVTQKSATNGPSTNRLFTTGAREAGGEPHTQRRQIKKSEIKKSRSGRAAPMIGLTTGLTMRR
ncbi:MAG: hypothetical protein AAFV53_11265 [Myxococcota bacterium]